MSAAQVVAWVVATVGFVGLGVALIAGLPSKSSELSGAQMAMVLCWFITMLAVVMAAGAGSRP